jgi:phosphotriesterase-related protein
MLGMAFVGLAAVTCVAAEAAVTGTIQTVCGPVAPADLGPALTHEHVLVDFIGADRIAPGRYDPEDVFRVMLPHLQDLRAAGVTALFDCTPDYLGRDPLLLRRLSQASGVALITNTGYYKDPFLPAWVHTATPEQIARVWIAEARDGIGDTGIRPGFIKIAANEGSLSDVQATITRAAGLTALATGLVIASHTTQAATALEQLDILTGLGVPASQFIQVHADAETDADLRDQVAARGAWLSLDGIRRENAESKLPLVMRVARSWPGQVLISQDAGWYNVGEPEGGNVAPFAWLPREFTPMLERAGLTEAERHWLLVRNPARAFALRPVAETVRP